MRVASKRVFLLFQLCGVMAWAGQSSYIRLFDYHFQSNGRAAHIQSHYLFLSADLKSASELSPSDQFVYDLAGYFAPGAPYFSNLNVRNFYYQSNNLKLGRVTHQWSLIDESWQLGLFEPQFRSQSFIPEKQGLVGLLLEVPLDAILPNAGFYLFASPLSFPDQGPGYLLENGRFKAQNPWFDLPPSQAYISNTGVMDDIQYDIIIPNLDKIIVQSAFGGSLRWGDHLKTGHFAQVSFFSKTSPALNLAAQAYARSNNSIFVEIHPTSERHQIAALDYSFLTSEQQVFGIGYLFEQIDPLNLAPELTTSYLNQRSLVHFKWQYPILNSLSATAMILYPHKESQTILLGPQQSELSQILAIQRWVPSPQYQIELKAHQFLLSTYQLGGSLLYRYLPYEKFQLIRLMSEVQVNLKWALFANLEWMSSDRENSFYYRFRHLDWVQLGVQYAL